MLGHLLGNGGEATAREIAKAILSEDKSQIEYYERITKGYSGRELSRNRGMRKNHLEQEDRSIKGFTVTFDAIREPHQTDSHCHMHLIPQRA